MPWWILRRKLMEQENGGEGSGSGPGGTGGDGGEGGGGDGKSGTKTDDKAKGGGKTDDETAKLLKESMKRKEQIEKLQAELKKFEGVDVDAFKRFKEAEEKAETDRKTAETKHLEEKGEWGRLRQRMVDEHDNAVKSLKTELGTFQERASKLESQIVELTIGAAFSGSKFIGEDLTLTPAKARAVFGSHFEIKDGQVVAYDKPAGSANRTPLVDARGEHLSFEEALKKIVDSDPDRDLLLKAKLKAGSGSGGASLPSKPGTTKAKSPQERIASGLAKQFTKLV